MERHYWAWMVLAAGLLIWSASAWATTYDLNTNTAYDLNIIGGKANDQLGYGGVTTADLDEDGNLDLIINAYNVDFNGNSDVGAVYIIWKIGSRSGTTIDLNADKPVKDFNIAIFGSAGSDNLGFNGVGIGEIDRDGKLNDIAIGAAFADPKSRSAAGIVYVFKDINSESGIINLALQSGQDKVDLNILGAVAGDNLGWAQTSFGDSNSDGYKDDLVIGGQGATYNANAGAGCVYLINGVGSKLGSIDLQSTSAVNLKVCGNAANDAVGYEGNFFGDFDLDGYEDDWLFGEWQGSSATTDALMVINSAGLESGTITDVSPIIDLNILGASIRQSFCIRPCVFADADNDGNSTDDFFLTAGAADPLSRSDAGQVMVFEDIRLDGSVINLTANSGKAKVDLNIYGSVAGDALGWGGISMGDLDGDGRKETMAVGAYGHDPLGRSAAGIVYLFDDVTTLSGIIDLNSPGTSVDHNFIGSVAGDNLGLVTPHFADVDNDGVVDDLFIGGTNADPSGRSNAGIIWLYSLGSPNVDDVPLVQVDRIDGDNAQASLSPFSYAIDGNLTIDLNVMDDSPNLILDLNYANSSVAEGTGTPIVDDLNLSALGTTGPYRCADTDLTNVTRCSIDFNIAGLYSSTTYILARVYDLNNSDFNYSGYSFVLDSVAPTTSWDGNNATWQNTDANVHLTCSDNHFTCTHTRYRLDTDSTSTASMGSWTTFDRNILITADGNWALDFNSMDDLNNIETTIRYSIQIDTNNPTVSITSPENGSTSTTSSVTVTYAGSDPLSGIASYSVSTDGSSFTSNGTNTSYSFTGLTTGEYTLYVRATDNAGNSADANVSVSVAIASTASSDSGGGGGNAFADPTPFISPPTPPAPTSEKTASFAPNPPGTPVVLHFNHAYLHPVERITLTSNETIPPISMIVSTAEDIPSFDEDAEECGSFSISPGKKIGVAYAATITFRVKKECVEGNESTKEDVTLYHHDEEWEELSTQYDFETEDEYYYSAQTNGFSPFLIGVKKSMPTTIVEEPAPMSDDPPHLIEENPLAEENHTLPPNPIPTDNPIVGVFVLILLGLAVFIRFHRPPKGHHLDGW